jgi:hypothetical protein
VENISQKSHYNGKFLTKTIIMETLVEKNSKLVEHTVSVLQEETVITLKEVWEFANFNNYVYNRHPKYNVDDLNAAIGNLTLNQRKKLKKRINIFRMKKSLSSANRFYHHVYAKVLKVDMRVKLSLPEKHLEIMRYRGRYLLLRAQMEVALTAYKEEKGDYFKLRLEEGKKLQ